MRDYKLGDIIISTTEERYESTFKTLGYEPVETKKKAETKKTVETKKKSEE